LLFLKRERSEFFRSINSPIYKVFQLSELSLKIFNENLKLFCHANSEQLKLLHGMLDYNWNESKAQQLLAVEITKN
jgi:hypothetical protein